jgi:hypothetical protein
MLRSRKGLFQRILLRIVISVGKFTMKILRIVRIIRIFVRIFVRMLVIFRCRRLR